jgi:hypothetical protein
MIRVKDENAPDIVAMSETAAEKRMVCFTSSIELWPDGPSIGAAA